MTAVIFLGPSLPVAAAREILDAVYLPPAKVGDIVSAVGTYRPDVIGLIDGEFGQSLSVWHKEILHALEAGIAVFGASSMGALRAAECDAFGMVGVGQVYRMFASGELNDDDEVALAHGTADVGYRGLSEPMVNIRATFRRAVDAGVVDAGTAERLVGIAKRMYFPERTIPSVLREAAAAETPPDVIARLRKFVAEHYADVKREDAIALLETVRDLPRPAGRAEPSFTLNRTIFFRTLYECDRTVRHDGVDVPLSSIASHAALHHPDFAEINDQALNRALVAVLGDMLEVEASDEDVAKETARFRRARRLVDDDALAAWLHRNDLTAEEFRETMRDAAVRRRLQRWLITRRFAERTVKLVLDELRRRGEYEATAKRAAAQERLLSEHHRYFKESSFRDLTTRQLVVDHLRATPCAMDAPFPTWAEEAGFGGVEDLHTELLRARLAREVLADVTAEAVRALGVSDAQAEAAGG